MGNIKQGFIKRTARELSDFLSEIEQKIEEYMRMKSELEEVRMLTEAYIKNLMCRIAKESEEQFDELLTEFEGVLPREILEDLKRIKRELI